jgi:mono/diheme cytochrome c family protein
MEIREVFSVIDGRKPMNLGRLLGYTAMLMLVLILLAGAVLSAQDDNSPWMAPDDAKKVRNPVKSSPDGIAAAAQLYRINCSGCHGSKGDGNGPAAEGLPRKPANFTDAKMMKDASDGELFWKITNGRPPMPDWERLSETQRWQLVNYLRTFGARAAGSSSK